VVTAAQKQRLKEVQPLRIGRSSAKDKLKRVQVTEEDFTLVLDHVNSVVADLLRLIWLTAMRPSEACRMRAFDIVRTKPECWLYIPGRDASPVGDHKTAHHRRVRAIPLTATAQEILGRRVKDWESKDFIFSPAEALDEMRAKKFATRRTPVGQGNCAGTNRQPHPMIKPGIQYNSESLATAVKRGCGRVGVARFTPYDLRRSAATRVRSVLDKDAAKLLLGHVSTETTEIYLLDEVKEAMNVAMKLEKGEGSGIAPRTPMPPKSPETQSP
jgi:integrase